jgi:hypothetical protein
VATHSSKLEEHILTQLTDARAPCWSRAGGEGEQWVSWGEPRVSGLARAHRLGPKGTGASLGGTTLNFIVKLFLLKELLIDIFYNSILIFMEALTKYIYLELYKESSIIEDLIYIFNKVIVV